MRNADLCEDVLYTLLASAPPSGVMTQDIRGFSAQLKCQPNELLAALRHLDEQGSFDVWRVEGNAFTVALRSRGEG